MNELNDKAINICQAIIGFKLGVSDDEINQAISDVTSIPMYAGLDKTELKKSLLAIYNVKVDTYQILEGRDARIPWLKEFKAERQSEWLFGPGIKGTWPNKNILRRRLFHNWTI